jgi:glycosyltransferase involved in cell wall biosynthesis
MKIAGMLRVKNEAQWIEEVVQSLLPVCASVSVLDDHSTDETAAICERQPRTRVYRSHFTDLDEARDKNYLLGRIREYEKPDWVLQIDGDEVLDPSSVSGILRAIRNPEWSRAYSVQIVYLWDRPDQIRTDGIYADFWRPSLFCMEGSTLRFRQTGNGGNFHCGSVPADLTDQADRCDARVKHYGYMERARRLEKFRWYNSIDPDNRFEDGYRHMVQGDLPEVPADRQLRHAGPLRLAPWQMKKGDDLNGHR